MDSEIERLEKKRMRYLELNLVGFFFLLTLSLVRFFFRAGDLNTAPVGMVVLGGMILSVLIMGGSAYGSAVLGRRFKTDPSLKEALFNELVQMVELDSWKAAYIGAAASTVFFAVLYFLYPVYDPVLVALNSIITGAAAYQFTFYFKYKSYDKKTA
jgi:hypothetical protein